MDATQRRSRLTARSNARFRFLKRTIVGFVAIVSVFTAGGALLRPLHHPASTSSTAVHGRSGDVLGAHTASSWSILPVVAASDVDSGSVSADGTVEVDGADGGKASKASKRAAKRKLKRQRKKRKKRKKRKVKEAVHAEGEEIEFDESMMEDNPALQAMMQKANLWNELTPVMTCTACERIMFTLQNELSKYILAEKDLDEVRFELQDRIWGICEDQEAFPPTNEHYLKGCNVFMDEHWEELTQTITERLDPDSDVYQEDIATYWYCRQVGACEEGMESLDEQLRRADL